MHIPKHDPSPETGVLVAFGAIIVGAALFTVVCLWSALTALLN